ncbi:MAG: hypothetical protein ACI8QS_001339 [Planctomycetota bacterium]|jgi:hypothetical protein
MGFFENLFSQHTLEESYPPPRQARHLLSAGILWWWKELQRKAIDREMRPDRRPRRTRAF